MHDLVDFGHSMTHAAVGLCRDETRTSEHIGISPAEEGWTVANEIERYLVAALTCNVLLTLATVQPSSAGLMPICSDLLVSSRHKPTAACVIL
jgi:hypothetical protein